jgi:hypothetical protein
MTRRLIMAAVLALCAGARADEWSQMIGQTDQVTRGLVAYYSMRTVGTQVLCELQCANGTASNGVTFSYANGAVGDGASFASNQTQYITMSNTLDMGTSSMTITAWVRTSNAVQQIAGKRANVAGLDGYALWVWPNGNLRAIFGGAAAGTYVSPDNGPSIGDGAWNFVAGVWDRAGNMQAWVNGVNTGNLSISGEAGFNATNNEPFLIGVVRGASGSFENRYNGQIDEVRVYMRVLSADEIRQIYRMGATPRRIKE